MITNIRHTGIVVHDLNSAIDFYQDLLGFEIVKQLEETGGYIDRILGLDGVRVTTIKMAAPGGQIIELLKFHSHDRKGGPGELYNIGISHISLTVDNLDLEYETLKSKGVEFNAPPQLSPDGLAKVTFCRSPEGVYIELVEDL